MRPAVIDTLALVFLVTALKVRDRPSALERRGRSNRIFVVVRSHGRRIKAGKHCINIQ
jgi:hypothetical protein